MLFKFAFANMLGSGLKMWLNVIIMSIVFGVILFMQGFYEGFQYRIEKARIDDEVGRFQLWHQTYDPLDPLTFRKSHSVIPPEIEGKIDKTLLTPVLLIDANIYPQGKLRPVTIKGIDPEQSILQFPTQFLSLEGEYIPAIMGKRMAKKMKVEVGDFIAISWKNFQNVIDAEDIKILKIFDSDAPTIDTGIVWIPLRTMQKKMAAGNQATYFVASQNLAELQSDTWVAKTQDDLLSDIRKMMEAEKGGASFLYIILLFLAAITILDTQILSIFRRRKEIGLLMALGLTQRQVVGVFTIEGTLQALIACVATALCGGPILYYLQENGIYLMDMEQFGLAGGNAIFPRYSWGLVVSTFVFVMGLTTFLSYWPARKIGKLSPVDALRGKWR